MALSPLWPGLVFNKSKSNFTDDLFNKGLEKHLYYIIFPSFMNVHRGGWGGGGEGLMYLTSTPGHMCALVVSIG